MTNYNKAKFITFEGGEGSGKTTQSKMLYEYFVSKGVEVILTREIGGTKEAEKIRELLLYNKELFPMTELMLVMAARYEHLYKVIIPALKRGVWVICDRFIDSTICYQGQNVEIGAERIYSLHHEIMSQKPLKGDISTILNNEQANNSTMPDVTFFIDIPPSIALDRTIGRKDNNKFEDREIEFHEEVYMSFQKNADNFKNRIIKIDAGSLTPEEIHQQILLNLI